MTSQVLDELLLLGVLAEDGGHVLAQRGDDVGVHLGQPRPLDQVVQLPQSGVPTDQ